MSNYGEFEEIETEGKKDNVEVGQPSRVRAPKKDEIIGVIIQRYGGNRMEVCSTDGKRRNCRVPGKYKRELWLRPNDIVLIKPWKDDDEKADIIFKYNPSAVSQLRKRGILNFIKNEF
ncbi:MAG: translation initiation factor IF-1A [Nanoarchaeota archaeon]